VELEDLNHNERLALLALMQRVIAADGHVSDGEVDEIATLTEAFGDDAYHKAFDEAAHRFGDEETLKSFLPTIDRVEARELIVGTLLEAAIPGAVEGHESALLEWLEEAWDIDVSFQDQPE
jgi:uncharacterized tellurite resistance protein B-like protein